jgi:hypothetical protein
MVIDSENQIIYCFGGIFFHKNKIGRILSSFDVNNYLSGFYKYEINNNKWTNLE